MTFETLAISWAILNGVLRSILVLFIYLFIFFLKEIQIKSVREDHVGRVAILLGLPVDLEPQVHILRVVDLALLDERADGAECVVSLGSAPGQPCLLGLVLQAPCGHVERKDVATDVLHGHVGGDVPSALANDHSELNLVVQLGARRWHFD